MHAYAIGDSDLVTGFRLVGVEGSEVATVDDAKQALATALSRSDVALIIVSEDFSTKMRNKIDHLRSSRITPLVVEIPGRLGPTGEVRISDLISKTIGIKI